MRASGSTARMRIIRAILAGERDPGCKQDAAAIAKALQGNWRKEHLFALRQAMELYDSYREKIAACDQQILAQMSTFDDRSEGGSGTPPPVPPQGRSPRKNELSFDAVGQVYRLTGVDLTRIDGIQGHTALKVIGEIGVDMRPWPTDKHFASWLGLCPENRISGGKKLGRRKAMPNANRAAAALRLAAHTLHHSNSYLDAFLRRMKARLGMPKAIEATAHKLAILIYHMLKDGADYVDKGQDYYDRAYQNHLLKQIARQAKRLGYQLVKEETPTAQAQPAWLPTVQHRRFIESLLGRVRGYGLSEGSA